MCVRVKQCVTYENYCSDSPPTPFFGPVPLPFPSVPAHPVSLLPLCSPQKNVDLDSLSSYQCPQLNYTLPSPHSPRIHPLLPPPPPKKKKSWIWILCKLHLLESLKLELYDLYFSSYSYMIIFKCGLY